MDKVNHVGHTLTSQGLQPDPEKIRAIVDMPPPSDKVGVQRLLGTVNYLDKFIENKAAIQGPISQLLQKDAAFVWDTQQQLAFDELKQVISKSLVLAYFDNNKQTVLARALFQQPFSLVSRSYYKRRVNLNNLSYIKAQTENTNQGEKKSIKHFVPRLMLTNAMSLAPKIDE